MPTKKKSKAVAANRGGEVTLFVPREIFKQSLPPKAYLQLRYAVTTVISGYGTLNILGPAIDFQVNSIFAPGGGAGAHQPYMRDTLFAQYNKYRVHACHVHLTIPPQTDGVQSYLITQVAPPNVTVSSENVAIGPIRERYDGRFAPTFDVLSTANRTDVRFTIDMPKACGVPKATYIIDDEYAAAMGSDPTNKAHLLVNVASSSSTTFTTYLQTLLVFDVELFERLIVSTS